MNSELELISFIKNLSSASEQIGDDGYVLEDSKTVISTDSFVEGVHFKFPLYNENYLAGKCIRSSVSDIYASGAIPTKIFLNLSTPKNHLNFNARAFLEAIDEECINFSLELAGGDLTSSSEVSISITVIGELFSERIWAKEGPELRESDLVLYLGSLGGPYLARTVRNWPQEDLVPKVKPAWGELLKSLEGIKSATDLSDGFAFNLRQLLGRQWGAEIIFTSLNLRSSDRWKEQISGGEDQGILMIADPNSFVESSEVKIIGEVTRQKKILILNRGDIEILSNENGYEHF